MFGDIYRKWAEFEWNWVIKWWDIYVDKFEDEWTSIEKIDNRFGEMELDEIWGYWGIAF